MKKEMEFDLQTEKMTKATRFGKFSKILNKLFRFGQTERCLRKVPECSV